MTRTLIDVSKIPKWADPTRPRASHLALLIARTLARKDYLQIPARERGWGLAKWNTDSAAEVIEVVLNTESPAAKAGEPQEGKEKSHE